MSKLTAKEKLGLYYKLAAKELFEAEYTTIGEIVEDNKDFIVVAATCDNNEEDPLYSDASMIPKTNIVRITKI